MRQELLEIYTEKELEYLLKEYSLEYIYEYSKPQTVEIGSLKDDINIGESVYVDSPDGFVGVGDFVDKGMWEEYLVTYDDKTISVNENHLFLTPNGWELTKDLLFCSQNDKEVFIADDQNGFKRVKISKTGKQIPIVDIQINHENHQYYTEGLVSHNTNVGKSALMCFLAGEMVKQGKNVLYVSAEMSEEAIYERIDANLLDITTDQLKNPDLDKEWFMNKVAAVRKKGAGRFYAKEYPTSTAHAGHIDHLLKELKQKKKFTPDIIFIDYINIFTSSRYKTMSGVNSYSYIKAIAEEMRGLAVTHSLPIISVSQLNRSGINEMQPDMTDTSESMGLPMTCDWISAIVTNDELQEMNQQLILQLKTRYGAKKGGKKSRLVEVEFEKMRYRDINDGVSPSSKTEKDLNATKANFDTNKKKEKSSAMVDDWDL